MSVRKENFCLASKQLAKMSLFYICGHIKALALEHTMAENLPAHTGIHAAVEIKLIASVSSHMHG
jgi:hypothetical protein